MTLKILHYGAPVLRAKGKAIEKIDDRILQLAMNMIETMHEAHGVGLAAQQVGEALQLTVLDVSAVADRPSTLKLDGKNVDANRPLILINPHIELGASTEIAVEGCLSIPDIAEEVRRSLSAKVWAQDSEGKLITIESTGLLARALQHEVDHLNGILFTDRVTSAVKVRIAGQLRRLAKQTRRTTLESVVFTGSRGIEYS